MERKLWTRGGESLQPEGWAGVHRVWRRVWDWCWRWATHLFRQVYIDIYLFTVLFISSFLRSHDSCTVRHFRMDLGGGWFGGKPVESTRKGPCVIPALQQVLSATRGATDVLSGAGRHLNGSLRKLGVKGLEAGVGCGVGVGHGFGVGLAIKPSAIQQIQLLIGQALGKIITNLGMGPSISSLQRAIPGSLQSSTYALSGTFDNIAQISTVNPLQLATSTTGGSLTGLKTDDSLHPESRNIFDLKETSLEMPVVSHSEKVISSFLKNPALKNEKEMEIYQLAEKQRSENDMLQVLLNHQQILDKLMEENEKLRRILLEDLKISPSKLETSHGNWGKSSNTCSDCFECRRKRSRR